MASASECERSNQPGAPGGCLVEDIGVWYADNPSSVRIREINHRLTAAQAKNDLLVEVCVSLETRLHALGLGAP